jgi:hypothetical protein
LVEEAENDIEGAENENVLGSVKRSSTAAGTEKEE